MAGPDDADQIRDMEADIDLDPETSAALEKSIATPETYDKRSVQDRSGLLMQALPIPVGGVRAQKKILGPYAMLKCPRCHSEKFAVACSATDNFISIVCADRGCGAMWPVMEMNPVQMNDRVARDHHLWVPNTKPRNIRDN
jgi:hypothetical protein